ncbi:MAG: serine/threonine-protein kinase [Pirellulaceae bacterium]
MNHGGLPSESDAEREMRLAQILTDLSDRTQRGEYVSLAEASAAHPEFAMDLQQLWGAVMLADAVGVFSSSASKELDGSLIPALNMQLPCHFGDYELITELGRGGMGVVYRARQRSLNRDVAIKMLLRGGMASREDEARFRREAESAARLTHPNIVPVYEVGELEGRLFFSMKLVQGLTLAQRLMDGTMDSRTAATVLRAVARAIQYAHSQGILHRDLKPSNILLDSHGHPHVTDFGLAREVDSHDPVTYSGSVLGTPAYMAPEQAAGDRGHVGPASDVYSLGSVLYHMITGRSPFQAATPVDMVLLVLEQEPPLPRLLNPQVDRDLEMIALRCLQKPPDLRYASAGDLADDLEAFLRDEPVMARSGRLTHVVARWFRETHHATVLENWGLLWMWHSLALLVICSLTHVLYSIGQAAPIHYFLLWTAGLGAWAAVFWALRRRMGPVTFVERQIAHIWAASMISIALLFPIEYILGLPVLTLSPILGLSSGMVFLIKAGMLSGSFYVQAVALFATALAMARWPEYAHLIFGLVAAACFFFPGWKYYRQRLKSR